MINKNEEIMRRIVEDESNYNAIKPMVNAALTFGDESYVKLVIDQINSRMLKSEDHKETYRKYLIQLNDRLIQLKKQPTASKHPYDLIDEFDEEKETDANRGE